MVEGQSTESWHMQPENALEPGSDYWLVVAENGGGTSDDVP
jgi:hypothetical protein